MPTTFRKRNWNRLLNLYGLTEFRFKQILLAQNFACKICLIPDEESILNVDHCHKTGKIRGLICGHCNKMLGMSKDNPVTLLKGIQYLKGKL